VTGESAPQSGPGGGWDTYWRGTGEAAAYSSGGPQDVILAQFWGEVFSTAAVAGANRVLDLACGNGVLAGRVLEAFLHAGVPQPEVYACDALPSAVQSLRQRFPAVKVIAADARQVPLPGLAFDLVTSQFGVEYAGNDAFAEAARLVAPGGTLAAVVHHEGGAMYRECALNLEAARAVGESGVLAATRDFFMAHEALRRGQGSRPAFRRAEGALAAAVGRIDAVLRDRGPRVAGGQIHRLRADVADMSSRAGNFDPREVARWTNAMAGEMSAYADRMAAMLEAARSRDGMMEVAAAIASRGLTVLRLEELWMGAAAPEPAAWSLVCRRG